MYVFAKEGASPDVFVRGTIYSQDAAAISDKVLSNLHQGVKRVVIDLSECIALTSDLVCAFSKLQRELEQRSISLYLDYLSSTNKRIYGYLHMDEKLPLFVHDSVMEPAMDLIADAPIVLLNAALLEPQGMETAGL